MAAELHVHPALVVDSIMGLIGVVTLWVSVLSYYEQKRELSSANVKSQAKQRARSTPFSDGRPPSAPKPRAREATSTGTNVFRSSERSLHLAMNLIPRDGLLGTDSTPITRPSFTSSSSSDNNHITTGGRPMSEYNHNLDSGLRPASGFSDCPSIESFSVGHSFGCQCELSSIEDAFAQLSLHTRDQGNHDDQDDPRQATELINSLPTHHSTRSLWDQISNLWSRAPSREPQHEFQDLNWQVNGSLDALDYLDQGGLDDNTFEFNDLYNEIARDFDNYISNHIANDTFGLNVQHENPFNNAAGPTLLSAAQPFSGEIEVPVESEIICQHRLPGKGSGKCGHIFSTIEDLWSHYETDHKLFNHCRLPGCYQSCKEWKTLKRHLETVHYNNAKVYCDHGGCKGKNSGYKRHDSLLKHRRNKHPHVG